jgi:hypothetical protein
MYKTDTNRSDILKDCLRLFFSVVITKIKRKRRFFMIDFISIPFLLFTLHSPNSSGIKSLI